MEKRKVTSHPPTTKWYNVQEGGLPGPGDDGEATVGAATGVEGDATSARWSMGLFSLATSFRSRALNAFNACVSKRKMRSAAVVDHELQHENIGLTLCPDRKGLVLLLCC